VTVQQQRSLLVHRNIVDLVFEATLRSTKSPQVIYSIIIISIEIIIIIAASTFFVFRREKK
jgi:subtilase family serine protease